MGRGGVGRGGAGRGGAGWAGLYEACNISFWHVICELIWTVWLTDFFLVQKRVSSRAKSFRSAPFSPFCKKSRFLASGGLANQGGSKTGEVVGNCVSRDILSRVVVETAFRLCVFVRCLYYLLYLLRNHISGAPTSPLLSSLSHRAGFHHWLLLNRAHVVFCIHT